MSGSVQVTPNVVFGYDPTSHLYVPIQATPVLIDPANNEEYALGMNVNVVNATPQGPALMAGSLPVTMASNQPPISIEDFIRAYIIAGQGFSVTTGIVATGIANAFVGLELLANAIAKNVLIYNVFVTGNGSTADGRLYQGVTNTTDAGLTVNLAASVVNQGTGASNPSGSALTSIIGSPAATVEVSGLVGVQRGTFGILANAENFALNLGSLVYIPKNTVQFMAAYAKVVTSGNNAAITAEWIEF